jgi:hypothetical protein
MIGRAPRHFRNHARKAKFFQIKRVNKRFNNSNRIIFADAVVQTFGQQTHLSSCFALNKSLHEGALCGNA